MAYGKKKGGKGIGRSKSKSDPFAPHTSANAGTSGKKAQMNSGMLFSGGKKPPKAPTSL